MQLHQLLVLLSLSLSGCVFGQRNRNRRTQPLPPITRSIPLPLNDCPNGVLQRKEYRDMTQMEWQIFHDALLTLQTSPSPDGGQYTEWDWITRVHLDYVPVAHDHPAFFPWHRLFVSVVEKRLQRINPLITIPYWDWSYDWAHPLRSPIFSPQLGFDVKVGPSGDCRYPRQFPTKHCLIRNYDPTNFTAFYPSETIDALIRSARDFDQIRQRIEWVPHGIVHAAVGGSEGDMTAMHSPNDPIFWLHHSNIDKLWWEWQNSGNKSNSTRSSQIDRMTDYRGRTADGTRVTGNDMLNPFGLRVNQTFYTEALCYTYAPFSQTITGPGRGGKSRSRTRPSRGFFLPDPIPSSWIRMHGMKVQSIRKAEAVLVQLMAVQHQQADDVSIDENNLINVAVNSQ